MSNPSHNPAELPAVAAVDPSLGGAAVWVGREYGNLIGRVYAAGPPAKTTAGRIARWQSHAAKIIGGMMPPEFPRPSLVIVEGYSYGSKGQAVIDLGEFGGILRAALVDRFRVIEVAPTVVKKFATTKGNAGKELVIGSMTKRFGCVFDNSDQYDALALWLLGHLYLVGEASPLFTRKIVSAAQVAVAKSIG